LDQLEKNKNMKKRRNIFTGETISSNRDKIGEIIAGFLLAIAVIGFLAIAVILGLK